MSLLSSQFGLSLCSFADQEVRKVTGKSEDKGEQRQKVKVTIWFSSCGKSSVFFHLICLSHQLVSILYCTTLHNCSLPVPPPLVLPSTSCQKHPDLVARCAPQRSSKSPPRRSLLGKLTLACFRCHGTSSFAARRFCARRPGRNRRRRE